VDLEPGTFPDFEIGLLKNSSVGDAMGYGHPTPHAFCFMASIHRRFWPGAKVEFVRYSERTLTAFCWIENPSQGLARSNGGALVPIESAPGNGAGSRQRYRLDHPPEISLGGPQGVWLGT